MSNTYTANEVVNELTSLKLSMNKSVRDCLKAAANSIFLLAINNITQASKGQLSKVIDETFENWKSLMKKFMNDQDDELFLIDCLKVILNKVRTSQRKSLS